ncbi:MAG TPA: helical backbone metal receptor [Candidatus Limnocylindrales bacterium]|nr:helical backbone metal receptor [Candidatus Limnocylindrales bacterium]
MNSADYLSGTERRIPFAPERAVSLLPWVSESLAELMLADRLVGVTDDAVYPTAAFDDLMRVGPSAMPDVGRILDLRPDLVLLGREHGALAKMLDDYGVAVWLTGPQTVRESFNLLWDFMNSFEGPQMVERVRAMEWTCDWLERLAETRMVAVHTAVLWAGDAPAWAEDGNYTADLVRLCGGELVVEPNVGVMPEVLLVATFGGADVDLPDRVQAGELRVHLLEGTLLTWPGTRVARAFDVLPALLEPAEQGGL